MQTMTDKVLSLRSFSFSYEDKKIISDINFSAEKGEYIAIIGPNGAGKSTLLKCINRILQGGSGEIELMGRDIRDYSQKNLGRLIGYVSQLTELSFAFTVKEFIEMGRYPYLKPFAHLTKEDHKVVHEVTEITGLTSFSERDIHTLSGGERQKVYIAACLAQQPKILLLDEPTNYLDPKHQRDVQLTISNISKRLNITTLHVTHDLTHVAHWSHHVIALKAGKIIASGSPQEVLNPSKLKIIFDTDFYSFPNPVTKQPIMVPSM